MKKRLAALLAVLLLAAVCAFAEDAEPTVYTSGEWKYILLEDGTAEITDYNGTAEELAIPEELDGHRVTSIGDYTFRQSTSLTSVTIPDAVTSVVGNPFAGCIKLTDTIVSPDHPKLETIDGALFDKVEKKLICYPCAYTNASYVIPHGIRIIGDNAFYWCDSLTSITIPDSVTSIGYCAFFGCDSLRSITIPDSVTSIGDYAFSDCISRTSTTIPDSVTCIGDSAFFRWKSLPSIIIPEGVVSIGNYAFFNCDTLTSITLPNSLTSIEQYSFGRNEGRAPKVSFLKDPVFIVPCNSYTEQWCKSNNLTCIYSDANNRLLD